MHRQTNIKFPRHAKTKSKLWTILNLFRYKESFSMCCFNREKKTFKIQAFRVFFVKYFTFLMLQCQPRHNVRNSNSSHTASFGAHYGLMHLIKSP